jgi:hypothetical protein
MSGVEPRERRCRANRAQSSCTDGQSAWDRAGAHSPTQHGDSTRARADQALVPAQHARSNGSRQRRRGSLDGLSVAGLAGAGQAGGSSTHGRTTAVRASHAVEPNEARLGRIAGRIARARGQPRGRRARDGWRDPPPPPEAAGLRRPDRDSGPCLRVRSLCGRWRRGRRFRPCRTYNLGGSATAGGSDGEGADRCAV